jgi:hypothetical protein
MACLLQQASVLELVEVRVRDTKGVGLHHQQLVVWIILQFHQATSVSLPYPSNNLAYCTESGFVA